MDLAPNYPKSPTLIIQPLNKPHAFDEIVNNFGEWFLNKNFL
jgi:hypothetical protein